MNTYETFCQKNLDLSLKKIQDECLWTLQDTLISFWMIRLGFLQPLGSTYAMKLLRTIKSNKLLEEVVVGTHCWAQGIELSELGVVVARLGAKGRQHIHNVDMISKILMKYGCVIASSKIQDTLRTDTAKINVWRRNLDGSGYSAKFLSFIRLCKNIWS